MSKGIEKTGTREVHLLAAAKELTDLLYRWNVIDEYDLVIQSDRDGGTPYHHVSAALVAVLKMLGVARTGDFYDAVTLGESPADALARVIQIEHGFNDIEA